MPKQWVAVIQSGLTLTAESFPMVLVQKRVDTHQTRVVPATGSRCFGEIVPLEEEIMGGEVHSVVTEENWALHQDRWRREVAGAVERTFGAMSNRLIEAGTAGIWESELVPWFPCSYETSRVASDLLVERGVARCESRGNPAAPGGLENIFFDRRLIPFPSGPQRVARAGRV